MDKLESYRTTGGTCCKQIIFTVNDDDVLTSCKFVHGCSGNQQAISRLVVGRKLDDIIASLKGIPCKGATSCPDQLARALMEYKTRKTAEQR